VSFDLGLDEWRGLSNANISRNALHKEKKV
jgi:hypothetical protein